MKRKISTSEKLNNSLSIFKLEDRFEMATLRRRGENDSDVKIEINL